MTILPGSLLAAALLPQALLAVACAASLVLCSCARQDVSLEKMPPAVRTFKVQLSAPVVKSDRYSAVIAPDAQIDVSFRASGYINYIHKVRGVDDRLRNMQEGDFLRKGTVLARIKQADYDAKVREQEAALEETKLAEKRLNASLAEGNIALTQAKNEFARASRLFEKNALTKPEYEDAAAKLEINDARVREAAAQISVNQASARRVRAALDQTRFAAQDCILRAPIDGILIKRNIEDGTLVSTGTVACTLADASSLKVSFGVPDVKLGEMSMGKNVAVTLEAVPNRVFQGRVTDVAPVADPRSRVFNVEVTLPNPDRRLRIGMVASLVAQETPWRALPMVPLSAVVRSTTDPDGYEVFVAQSQGDKTIVQDRQVKVGDAVGAMITIVEGLQVGDEVITDGSTRVASGQEVRLLN